MSCSSWSCSVVFIEGVFNIERTFDNGQLDFTGYVNFVQAVEAKNVREREWRTPVFGPGLIPTIFLV